MNIAWGAVVILVVFVVYVDSYAGLAGILYFSIYKNLNLNDDY